MKNLRNVKLKITANKKLKKNLVLKLLVLLMFISFPEIIKSQELRINIQLENVSLGDILQEIKKQSKKNILYNNKKVDVYKNQTIKLVNATLEEALKECLKNKNLIYKIVDGVIIIEPSEEKNKEKKSVSGEQVLRGQIIDLNTETPLIGASVILSGYSPIKGGITNANGFFEIKGVPVGRQNIEVSYLGYKSTTVSNIYVYAGKEAVLTVKLEEKVQTMEDVIVKSVVRKDQPLNEMAQVSARSFSVEETERYAGGFGDPSRMAASYAGILTVGTQINDIIIRGNSTTGMLWRMEGLRIPNPNHFGSMASNGGAISMINNNVLSNSDFYTGAFPAEFGDATSGIFDLKLRKGNNEKTEKVAQFGVGGFELGAEGPFSKKNNASYLANYRYSTFGALQAIGLNIGIAVPPIFQDLSFNLNVPLSKAGKISVFGIGGYNSLNGIDKTENNTRVDDTRMKSYLGFSGINHLYFINDKSSISTSFGISGSDNKTNVDVKKNNIQDSYYYENYSNSTFESSIEYKNKLNSRNYLKFGLDYYVSAISFADSFYLKNYNTFYQREKGNGSIPLFQTYGEWKHRLNDNLSFVGGIHYSYSKYGNDHSVEPRLSLSWNFLPKQSLNLGLGMHSKLQPVFVYHHLALVDTINKIYNKTNENLKMTRSNQVVLGYNYLFNNEHRFKIECYYQYLNKVPVEQKSSYKSIINYGTSFSDYNYENLTNKGTGYNYGTELTFEKFLSRGFYYLATLSLFEAKYKGSDGILRDSRFNAKYILNLVGGYEWFVNNRNTWGMDARLICAGGERKIPLNYEASAIQHGAVYDIPNAYKEKFSDYFRIDYKIYFKINKRTSHTIALDIINVTNRVNHFLAEYDADLNDYKEVSILAMLPSVLWRWNF
jgi:hypothetical protein